MWGSVTSVPLFKTAEQDPSVLRPVGIKSSFLPVLHRQVVRANTGALRDYLEPCQVALMPGGGAVLVHTVRMMLELRPDFVCVALDVRNAHNEISRRTVVEELSLRDFGDECSFVLEDSGPSFNCLNVAFASFAGCEETGKSSSEVFELGNA